MFYGTRFFYNLLYFSTAMAPAYILFALQLCQNYSKEYVDTSQNNLLQCGAIVLIMLFGYALLGLVLRHIFLCNYKNGEGTVVLDKDLPKYHDSEIAETNGNIVSFLLSNIIPAVITIGDTLFLTIGVFMAIQIICYVLITRSSEIFPNIILVIFGVDLCKTKSGDYIFVLRITNNYEKGVLQIGDPVKSKIYITVNNEEV